MDISCIVLTCILFLQMILMLMMLNPIYDVRQITSYINTTTKFHRKVYFSLICVYFLFVIFFGMYIPLQNIHRMIFNDDLDAYDKLILLSKVEKNYIIAGYSLFLVVVLYGVRALLAYTANLVQLLENKSEPVLFRTNSKKFTSTNFNENILPNLLKVKRSTSYEAILCANELKEQLKLIMKNLDYPPYENTLTSILESSSGHVSL